MVKRAILISLNLDNRNNKCCSSSISETLSASQDKQIHSFRGVFENLPVLIANPNYLNFFLTARQFEKHFDCVPLNMLKFSSDFF